MTTAMDPITFAVLQNALRLVVNEMNNIITRTAYSPIITEALDDSAALFDGQGRLVVHGDYDLPVFIGNLEFTCQAVLNRFGAAGLSEGDVVIMNDPYLGGTHLNDVRVIMPVFHEGQLVAMCAACGHWIDVGGMVPGSFAPDATEFFQEGLRMVPVKLHEKGQLQEGVRDLIMANVRSPRDRLGDLDAKVAAVKRGAERVGELIARYGLETVSTSMQEMMDYSERILRSEISKLKDGEYEWEDFIDSESSTNPTPKRVHLKMVVRGDTLIFDLSGSDSAARSACNSTFSNTASAIFVATKCIFPDFPMNHGCFEPVEIIAPLGSIVNAPYLSAVSGMAATTYEKLMAVVFGAFSLVVPERTMAAPYNLINLSMGGYDPRPGFEQDFVAYTRAEGGHGGRWTKDGVTGVISLYGSSSKNSPLEILERRYPLLHAKWSIRTDSGGAGRYRGGCGSILSFRILGDGTRITVLGDREKFPPFGLFGGKPGAAQGLWLNYGTDEARNLGMRATGVEIEPGGEITCLTAGGGGLGNRLERDPMAVAQDVADGFVSVEGALRDYGVVIDVETGLPDMAAAEQTHAKQSATAEDRGIVA